MYLLDWNVPCLVYSFEKCTYKVFRLFLSENEKQNAFLPWYLVTLLNHSYEQNGWKLKTVICHVNSCILHSAQPYCEGNWFFFTWDWKVWKIVYQPRTVKAFFPLILPYTPNFERPTETLDLAFLEQFQQNDHNVYSLCGEQIFKIGWLASTFYYWDTL